MAKPRRKRKPNLPRAPLPRQTGGIHRTRKNELDRKVKHKRTYHMLED